MDDLYEDREISSEEEDLENDGEIEKEESKESKQEMINLDENKNIKNENIKDTENKKEEVTKNEKSNENLNKLENNENLNIKEKKDGEKIKFNLTEKIQVNFTNEKENLQNIKNSKLGATISYRPKVKGSPSFKSSSGDIFLESQNYASYLKSLHQKGLKESKRETFCEGFFISSFPFKNPSVIEKSQTFPAPCGHEECSFSNET